MSRRISLPATLLLVACAFQAHAAPPPPRHPGTALAPRPLPPEPAVFEASVARWLTNPYGEVDGLRAADGTIVRFPPHLADAMTAAIKPGDRVRIIGRRGADGPVRADAIVNSATGQTVYDHPPAAADERPMPPHLRMASLQTQQAQGRIDTVLTGPRGEANGVILSDGSIVRFPPHSLHQQPPLQQGQPFAASGLGTRNAHGTSLEAISTGTTLADLSPLYGRAP